MSAAISPWRDHAGGYGRITRTLHWLMAALLAWQFTSVTLRVLAEDTAIEGFFWSTHFSVGFLLLLLACLRGAWGLINLGRRPAKGAGLLGRFAGVGHLLLYTLMIVVPLLALGRSYGRGRGFSAFGVQIFSPGGEPVPALVDAGSAFHGLLGWTLLVLIVGHIVMAFAHRPINGQPVLRRMTRGSA